VSGGRLAPSGRAGTALQRRDRAARWPAVYAAFVPGCIVGCPACRRCPRVAAP
jgi:hypothetical protein